MTKPERTGLFQQIRLLRATTQSDMPLQHCQRQAWRLHSPSYKRHPEYRHSCSLGLSQLPPTACSASWLGSVVCTDLPVMGPVCATSTCVGWFQVSNIALPLDRTVDGPYQQLGIRKLVLSSERHTEGQKRGLNYPLK